MDRNEVVRVAKRLQLELKDARSVVRDRGVRRQLKVWRHGFVAHQSSTFNFDQFGYDAFVSEFERKRYLPRLNRNTAVFRDKLMAFLFLREIGTPTPTVYAYGDSGHLIFLDEQDREAGLEGLLASHGRLVLKPRDGSHGQGFRLLERRNLKSFVNGREVSDLGAHLGGPVVLTEFVAQHDYARSIFPGSTNTIRVISLRDQRTGEPFVATACHRFGTVKSGPVDNTSAGGVNAGIAMSTGVVGPLAIVSRSDRGVELSWTHEHPDTGVRVTDTAIPRWDDIIRDVNRTMARLPECNWVGWDVVVTADRFTVIEGNAGPDITFQLFGPLLADERVRDLFEAHGVLSRHGRPRRRPERSANPMVRKR